MQLIRSLWHICSANGLPAGQILAIQSLIDRRKGLLHPYWIQLALIVPYDFAKSLYDELIANEWAIPDATIYNGVSYETKLTEYEIELIAKIELGLVTNCY